MGSDCSMVFRQLHEVAFIPFICFSLVVRELLVHIVYTEYLLNIALVRMVCKVICITSC